MKTVSDVQNQDAKGLSGAVSSRVMDARGQSPNIVVDARNQPGMTKEFAEKGLKRAFGADEVNGKKLREVTVLTTDGSVTYKR